MGFCRGSNDYKCDKCDTLMKFWNYFVSNMLITYNKNVVEQHMYIATILNNAFGLVDIN